jgi:hypothetical protein
MPKSIIVLIAALWAVPALCGDAQPTADAKTAALKKNGLPDSAQLESDLQHLPWKKFRSVIEAVPKMKADVEAYGPAGWKYVEIRYRTFAWKKGIDKLDEAQKQRLADLIRIAKNSK